MAPASLHPWTVEPRDRHALAVLSAPSTTGSREVVASVDGTDAAANAALILEAPALAAQLAMAPSPALYTRDGAFDAAAFLATYGLWQDQSRALLARANGGA